MREIDLPIERQCFKIHVDGSYDPTKNIGKIAWVVYLDDQLVSTNILPYVLRTDALGLEQLVFKIVNQIYEGAKIYTDCHKIWEEWKGKNKNRIYLIDSKDNLADALLRGKEIPQTYQKVPTYKFEYVKIREDSSIDSQIEVEL